MGVGEDDAEGSEEAGGLREFVDHGSECAERFAVSAEFGESPGFEGFGFDAVFGVEEAPAQGGESAQGLRRFSDFEEPTRTFECGFDFVGVHVHPRIVGDGRVLLTGCAPLNVHGISSARGMGTKSGVLRGDCGWCGSPGCRVGVGGGRMAWFVAGSCSWCARTDRILTTLIRDRGERMVRPSDVGDRESLWQRGVWLFCASLLLLDFCGCAGFRHVNEASQPRRNIRASDDSVELLMFKCLVLYPARDVLVLDPLWRVVFGSRAWNVDGGELADGAFWRDRDLGAMTPERAALGPCLERGPEGPFRVLKKRSPKHAGGVVPGFVGEDARGRKYFFKLDDPGYPELGSGAAIVSSRLLWALGYHVPATYLVEVFGTGDSDLDGRRGCASVFVEDVRGHFHFDWFRYRRELRGLRLASAWLNDTDRIGTNTLVAGAEDAAVRYYLIDFDSTLGAWQGRPKETWRGWRYQGDVVWALLELVTLGLAHPEPDVAQAVVSRAVGRFEGAYFAPLRWRSQVPNNAFAHMTGDDARWMAGRLRLLTRAHVEAVVGEACYSDAADAAYVVEVLMARRAKILEAVAGMR